VYKILSKKRQEDRNEIGAIHFFRWNLLVAAYLIKLINKDEDELFENLPLSPLD